MADFKLKGDKNPKIKSRDGDTTIKFYLSKEDLSDPETFESFIKSCELLIRKDPRYANYIGHLKNCGLRQSAMFSGINDDMVRIEMHHGPIFNLYDLCSIVIDHLLEDGEKICTFDIAEDILDEHEDNNIQVVMLDKTSHELAHSGKIFIHFKQSVGNIMEFIKKYKKGIKREHLYTLNEYIDLCKDNDATDNGFLEVCKRVTKYVK